jgi:hypothetical protein
VRRLANFGPRASCGVEKDLVENFATHRKTSIAKSFQRAPREFPDDERPIRRAHDHSRQLRSAGSLDFFEHSHRVQYARRLRAQIFRTRLRPGEARPVEYEYAHAEPSERHAE